MDVLVVVDVPAAVVEDPFLAADVLVFVGANWDSYGAAEHLVLHEQRIVHYFGDESWKQVLRALSETLVPEEQIADRLIRFVVVSVLVREAIHPQIPRNFWAVSVGLV